MVQFSRKPLCPQGVCDAFRAYVRQPGGARVGSPPPFPTDRLPTPPLFHLSLARTASDRLLDCFARLFLIAATGSNIEAPKRLPT